MSKIDEILAKQKALAEELETAKLEAERESAMLAEWANVLA